MRELLGKDAYFLFVFDKLLITVSSYNLKDKFLDFEKYSKFVWIRWIKDKS